MWGMETRATGAVHGLPVHTMAIESEKEEEIIVLVLGKPILRKE